MNAFSDIPSKEPKGLVVGDLWAWKRSDLSSIYAVADYNLSYVARLEGGTSSQSFNADETSNEFSVSLASTETEQWEPGRYQWQAFITRSSDSARIKVDEGYFLVDPDPGSAETDPRSHAVKTLAAIEALIEGRATKDVASYSINGRSLSKMTIDELMSFRRHYRKLVNNEKRIERAKKGGSVTNTRVIRFV